MKIRDNIYYLLLTLSFTCVIATYYWSIKYLLAEGAAGKNELLIGEALVILYSSPIWFGLIVYSGISLQQLTKTKVIVSVIPATLVFTPTVLRAFINAL